MVRNGAGGLVCGVPSRNSTSIKRSCPAVEENSECWCIHDECGVVSYCRCETNSHIPLSREEHAKADPTSNRNRHKINEATAAALVRTCNGCKRPFVKEDCNEMTCMSRGTKQCLFDEPLENCE